MLAAASVDPPPARTLPPQLDFDRTPTGLAGLLAGTGLADVVVRPVDWLFRIGAEDLWRAVVGGVATIGQTYRSQAPAGRERMRAAYLRLTAERHSSGELRFPSCALLAGANRDPG